MTFIPRVHGQSEQRVKTHDPKCPLIEVELIRVRSDQYDKSHSPTLQLNVVHLRGVLMATAAKTSLEGTVF